MRKQFKEDLKNLKMAVMEIFSDVIEQFEQVLSLLDDFDEQKAEKILKKDDLIDSKVLQVEEKGLQLMATQFPVARDLRFIHSVLIINIHLERIGDLAFNTVKALKRLQEIGYLSGEALENLKKMGENVLSIIKKAKKAFENPDQKTIEELPDLDEQVDEAFKAFLKDAGRFIRDEHEPEWYLSFALVARYFERAADQAVDIGERILFMITGEIAEID